MSKRKNIPLSEEGDFSIGNHLGAFEDLTKPAANPVENAPQPPKESGIKGAIRISLEHKGRGGKTVSLIKGFQGPISEAENLAKLLRKSLGCGASVEDGAIVLQGDQRERAMVVLIKNGAKNVKISGS